MLVSTTIVSDIPIPSYFKAYGSEVDIRFDAAKTWYMLEIGSINYDKATFKYRVFRWCFPYTTIEWIELPVTLYHAAMTEAYPYGLWIYGLDPNNNRYFCDVPGFVSLDNEPALAAEPMLNAVASGVRMELPGFTSDAPAGAEVHLSSTTLAYRRFQINRIAKRYGI